MDRDLDAIRSAALAELRRQPVVPSWRADAVKVVLVNVAVSSSVMAVASWSRHPRVGEVVWWVGAAMLAMVALLGAVAALRPGGRRLQHGVLALAASTIPVLVTAVPLTVVGASLFHDPECALVEVGVSLVPGCATAWALTRFAYQPLRALIGGLSAGASGLLVLHLACPVATAPHLLAFHVGPYVLMVVLLIVARARLTTRSHAP
jgi:hypothetical protein